MQQKLTAAAEHYEAAARLKPNDFQSVTLLMQVYHALGQYDKELDAARRSIARAEATLANDPENARAVYLGANALAVLGEIERSREWANRALLINPDDILTKYNIACLYTYFGDVEDAFDLLIEIIPRANHETRAWMLQDTDFEPMHRHPRWQQVVEMLST